MQDTVCDHWDDDNKKASRVVVLNSTLAAHIIWECFKGHCHLGPAQKLRPGWSKG
jgi:hypothetical protein